MARAEAQVEAESLARIQAQREAEDAVGNWSEGWDLCLKPKGLTTPDGQTPFGS